MISFNEINNMLSKELSDDEINSLTPFYRDLYLKNKKEKEQNTTIELYIITGLTGNDRDGLCIRFEKNLKMKKKLLIIIMK